MSDQTVGVTNQTGSGTELVDVAQLTVAGQTVVRQRIVIADPSAAGEFAGVTAAGALQVDGSAVTQPVSGTFWPATQPVSGTVTVNAGTGTMAVSAASLPLPTGAAADGTDATGVSQMTGGTGIRGWLSAIYAKLLGSIAVTGTFWQATQPVSGTVTANAGTGTMAVSAASLPLPTGAATSANQVAPVSAGSTTSGQNGPIVLAAATTSAPSLTAGQTNYLSLNLAGGLRVDGSGVTQPVSAASLPLPTGAATSANQVAPVAQGSTTSGQSGALVMGAVSTSAPSYTTGQTSPLSLTTSGLLRVDMSSSGAGAMSPVPKTTGGASMYRLNSATAATASIKASVGSLYGYELYNTNTALRYVHFYNKTSAPTLGTDTPVFTVAVPATSGVRVMGAIGEAFAAGIAIGVTSDNPAIPATTGSAGDIVGTVIYF